MYIANMEKPTLKPQRGRHVLKQKRSTIMSQTMRYLPDGRIEVIGQDVPDPGANEVQVTGGWSVRDLFVGFGHSQTGR